MKLLKIAMNSNVQKFTISHTENATLVDSSVQRQFAKVQQWCLIGGHVTYM